MILRRSSARVAMGLVASLALSAIPAGAQDTITRAKSLYQSADYDEALAVLDHLKNDPAAEPAPEVAAYRVFCLLALGRTDEARQNIEAILRRDPGYQPSESEASPRIRAIFKDERRRLLPRIFQERYDLAKTTFEHKEFQSAADQFKTLLALADDPALIGEESRNDFRMLIAGFVDLSQAAITTQAAAPAAAATTPSLPPPLETRPADAKPRIYGANDADVVAPVAISKRMPAWRPTAGGVWHEAVGLLELVVDERGTVAQASLRKGLNPQFDPRLIQAARDWKFQPALKQGQPVSYRFFMEVKLVP